MPIGDRIGEGVRADVAGGGGIADLSSAAEDGDGSVRAVGLSGDGERIAIRIGVVGARVESIGGVVLTT